MRKKVTILSLILATIVLIVPAESFAGAAGNSPLSVKPGTHDTQISVTFGQPRRRRKHWRNGRYRNYGQYRRTQVGYRRYRSVPRYYWYGGVRRVRYVRVYY